MSLYQIYFGIGSAIFLDFLDTKFQLVDHVWMSERERKQNG
jgi:hypothetical protein